MSSIALTGDSRRRERPVTIVAVLATVALLAGVWAWVDGIRLESTRAEVRIGTAMTAAPYAGNLGSALAKRLALVRGLAAFVSVEVSKGDIDTVLKQCVKSPFYSFLHPCA